MVIAPSSWWVFWRESLRLMDSCSPFPARCENPAGSVDGNTKKKIHLKYDLKGSSVNRSAKEGEKVLKDNDLDKTHGNFHLGTQRERFLQVLVAYM